MWRKGKIATTNNSKKIKSYPSRPVRYVWTLVAAWTIVVATSLTWNIVLVRQETLETARIQAKVAYEKDIIYRRWNTLHGGVYVPVTKETESNPFLSDIPERDITTPSGKLLTLMNPAYMTRQVHELSEEEYGIRGHITSLNPIRPQNAPDPWETRALQGFERGETETSSVEEIEDKEHMRLMRPLITEKGCLRCHTAYGSQEGDIRGGISVSIPMEPLWAIGYRRTLRLVLGHGFLWLLGLVGIVFGMQRLTRSEQERNKAKEALKKYAEQLEQRVSERTVKLEDRTFEIEMAKERLNREVIERRHAEEELAKHRDHLEELVETRTSELETAQEAMLNLVEDLNKSKDELEKRTLELEEMNIKIQEATRLKSQFLANMSHELRTPLNSIIGFTCIILQGIVGELNNEQKKQLNMVYGSAKHLLGLINDILDLSKIEAGKIEIIPAEFEIRELIQSVEKMVFPMIEKKGLTLQVAVSENMPQTICNDKNRIKQVLINLLSNAIKFTESGKIMVNLDFGLGIAELEKKESEIVFSVADTGIGIKPEHLSEVFDEFKQIEGPLKEKPTGTGLGLAISKKMVEMMGGRIWVESEYGKGSCFQFAIPVKEITTAKRPPAISPEALDLSKKLILTIDDEVESQEMLKIYLKTEGYEVIQAYNAMEAMELARKYRPFAITLDIIMPGKDGWDILHELKKDPQTKDIPVICISILDNREMGLFLGAFEYLVKPITKEQLMKELRTLEKRFRIYDILIVDDEPQAVELLAQYLGGETNNYRVAKAFGGKEGLAVVKERRPDLIILDLMMPEIDGFEVIRHLKKSEETKDIPIIIVSAKKLTQEEVEYLNRNIEKIIRKGNFSKQELLKDIKKALDGIDD